MQRLSLPERPHWRTCADSLGFTFHSMYGAPYWDESAAYRFSLPQIEDDLEDPGTELHAMCLAVVAEAVASEETLARLAIPPRHWDMVAESWQKAEPSLYGRFDLAYDGNGPAKLLEYNADTPTSLFEAAYFQWLWLEDQLAAGALPDGADQFNSIQDRLIDCMAAIWPRGAAVHFAACRGSEEDRQTVRYLEDCAEQAGMVPHFLHVEDIGLDILGRFCDGAGRHVARLFKLYPWEMMLDDAYAPHLAASGCRFVEPAWKSVLSGKGLLPLLWRRFPRHPNLLPACFDDEACDDMPAAVVRKPLHSREGANVAILRTDAPPHASDGPYGGGPGIVQAYAPLPTFRRADGATVHAVTCVWIVGDACCGLGMREDTDLITRDLSRFLPHWIAP